MQGTQERVAGEGKGEEAKKVTREMLRTERRMRRAALHVELKAAVSKLPFDINKADALQVAAFKVAHAEVQTLTMQVMPRLDRVERALKVLRECADASPVRLARIAYGDHP